MKSNCHYTVGIYTLGCKVNQYESSALGEKLENTGAEIRDFSDICDVYIINTCAVTEESVRKSKQLVRRAVRLNPSAFIAVSGCASQLSAESFSGIGGVDFICGTRNKNTLIEAVGNYVERGMKPRSKVIISLPEGDIESMSVSRFDRTRAYVKIQDGCGGRCAYCIIPKVRGSTVSRSREDIITEVRALAQNGCREVVLTGIETTAYEYSLADLLEEVNGIDGIERIRLGSLEPSFLKPEFTDRISNLPKVADHFHISVQSGSDRILALMRRRYNTEMLKSNIGYIRRKFPEVNFSADIIVGFPSETEEDFNATASLVKDMRFLHTHIFTYSPRPGTEAAAMDGQIDEQVKNERSARLHEIDVENKAGIMRELIGRGDILKVLIESKDSVYFKGHTANFIEAGISISSCGFNEARGKILNIRPAFYDAGIITGDLIE